MKSSPLKLAPSKKFKKDLKKISKQGKNRELINKVIGKLQKREMLELKYRDHILTGNYKGYRECHITPDWLLIYSIDDELELLELNRTGSHSELFK